MHLHTLRSRPSHLESLLLYLFLLFFVELGKTGYNAVNSLIINLGYYGVFYILYRAGVITFTMNTIILMFGFGMVTHFAVSLIEEKVFFQKNI